MSSCPRPRTGGLLALILVTSSRIALAQPHTTATSELPSANVETLEPSANPSDPEGLHLQMDHTRLLLRRHVRTVGGVLMALGTARLAGGVPLWIANPRGEGVRSVVGASLTGAGAAGAFVGLLQVLSARPPSEGHVRKQLRRRRDGRWAYVLGSLAAASLIGGATAIAVSGDPEARAIAATALLSFSLDLSVLLPVLCMQDRELRPYFPLVDGDG